MKSSKLLAFAAGLSVVFSTEAQDWQNVAIPANAGNNMRWQIQNNQSDSFNYTGKPAQFSNKWIDNHRAGWSGPGLTQFSKDYSWVADGNLIINSGKVNNIPGKRIFCGYVTTRTPIKFPVFTEVRMQVSGSWLSSNFWLLSADDVNEIDVTETYGKDNVKGRSMNTNYHIFQRSPFKDLTPNNGKEHKSAGNVLLKNGWHRFGVHWISRDNFIFYLDGKPVRWLNRNTDLKDPRGRFFDQSMHLIMNMEDHPWRVNIGKTPTDAELANNSINKMYVDWVRTYKPVPNNTGGGGGGGGSTAGAPIGKWIYLRKTGGDRKYVRAIKDGNKLAADAGRVGAWEKFMVETHPKGNIALKAQSDNKFVQVPNMDANAQVQNSGTFKGDWEHFQWKSKGAGKVALKSLHSNKWLQAAWNENNGIIRARGSSDQGWETFDYAEVAAGGKSLDVSDNNLSVIGYPNPTTEQISIQGLNENDKVTIYDANGVDTGLTKASANGKATIDVSGLPNGVYFTQNSTGSTVKFVKN